MKYFPTLTLACLLALAGHAQAQAGNDDHSAHHAAPTASSASAKDMTDGEVRKVDKAATKITLQHGPIKNLGMPGMTMAFAVKDPALLDKVKAGDKVKFTAASINGALVVTDLQRIK